MTIFGVVESSPFPTHLHNEKSHSRLFADSYHYDLGHKDFSCIHIFTKWICDDLEWGADILEPNENKSSLMETCKKILE